MVEVNKTVGTTGGAWKDFDLKSLGTQVKIPPELEGTMKELEAGYLRNADYTKKAQQAADERRVLAEDKAKHAMNLVRLESLQRNPVTAKIIEQLAANPSYVPNLAGQDQSGGSYDGQSPQSGAISPQLQELLGTLVKRQQQVEDRSTRNAAYATAVTELKDLPFANPAEIADYVVATGDPNKTPKEQVLAAGLALYGQQMVDHVYAKGRADYQRELDEKARAAEDAGRNASIAPSSFIVDDKGEEVPLTMANVGKLTPEQTEAILRKYDTERQKQMDSPIPA